MHYCFLATHAETCQPPTKHSTETVAAVETTNVFHRFRNKWNVDAFHKGFNFLVICHHIIPVILHFKFLMFLIFQKFILRKSETIFYPKFMMVFTETLHSMGVGWKCVLCHIQVLISVNPVHLIWTVLKNIMNIVYIMYVLWKKS